MGPRGNGRHGSQPTNSHAARNDGSHRNYSQLKNDFISSLKQRVNIQNEEFDISVLFDPLKIIHRYIIDIYCKAKEM